ncbi:MAG: acyltransferase [Coriobacteriales bacterium]|nr:acyltransferase [Coriobacteriales bacterium]
MAGGRIGWIDGVRALGASSIVLLHVLISTALVRDMDVAHQLAYSAVGIVLCRWAVPGFFMISGLLLLDPAHKLGWPKALRHAGRMAGVLATFGLAFALMEETKCQLDAGLSITPELLLWAIRDVLCMATWDHLWYVYALMGVYLLAPLLRALRDRVGEWGFAALTLVLFVGTMVVPTLLQLSVPNIAVGLSCFCAGGCLRKLRLCPLVLIAGLCSLATMLAVSWRGILAGEGDQGYIFLQGSCFACAYAVLVLALFKRAFGDKPLSSAALDLLAQDSFGIYIIHPLFVHIALMVLNPDAWPPVLFELGLFALALVASLASTRLLRHVPLVKSLI